MSGTSTWLRQRIGRGQRPLLLAILLGEASGILVILQTALLARIVDAALFGGAAGPVSAFAGLLAAAAARSAAVWGARRAAFGAASDARQTLRAGLMSALRAAGPAALAAREAGSIASTVVDAVEAVDAYYSKYLPQRAMAALLPLTALAVLFPLDWISALVLVLTAVFLPLSMVAIGEEALARNQKVWSRLAAISGRFVDVLQGLATLRMFAAARREAAELARRGDDYRRAAMSALRVAFVSSFALELISSLAIAIVAVLSGFRLLSGSMSFGRAYFVLLIAPEYFMALRALGTTYHARMEAVSAAERIREMLSPDPGPAGGRRHAPALQAGRPARVAFEGVEVDYGRGRVLDGAAFAIEPGERVALVGESGSGKSTILGLLLGLLAPVGGRVVVDGEDLAGLDRESWLRRVAWLPQRPTVFHGTLAENIRLGRRDADDAAVAGAARLAGVGEFLPRLPLGLLTRVGEGGHGLSVGQGQRVALARLFLRDPDLVLLDEPAAGLDAESERLVSAAVAALSRGRTTIVAAHRPVAAVDRVLVLRDGRVAT